MGQLLSRQARGPYWAIHSSIFEGCTLQEIEILEAAAQHAQRGNYFKALEIYSNNVEAFGTSASVASALETIDALGCAGLEKVRLEVLENVIEEAKSESYESLRIRDKTILHRAIDEYDDICVECLMAYHTSMRRVRQSSCWTEMEVDGLLPASAAPTNLSCRESQDDIFIYRQGAILTRVRRALQVQNKPLLAYRLCKTESSFCEGDSSIMPFREWLSYTEKFDIINSDVIITKIVFLRIFAAWNLVDQERAGEASNEIAPLATLLSSIGRSLDDVDIFYLRATVYLKWVCILIDLQAADGVVAIDSPTNREGLAEFEGAGDPWEYHDAVVSCFLEFEEQEIDGAYFMAAALSPIFIKLNHRGGTRLAEILKYYSEARARFPKFDVPAPLSLLLLSTISAAKKSGYDELATELEEEQNTLTTQTPRAQSHNPRKAEQDSLDHDWNKVNYEMTKKGGSPWKHLVPIASKIMMQWLHRAVLTGECLPETASTCLGLENTAHEPGELEDKVQITDLYREPTEKDFERISSQIFGKDDIALLYDE
ncbi:hypothetical protein LEL_07054 [Akanthomyces lecanii RCEF 1005]|uniref:Uncharacterized protein n=1 Tax=Akanthomyces lecanii RCEF 1005 TaxID=1081108 RepID=A0A168FEB6_CORDF|nr:hypothetical protein LEL_07054 [Akanthomyces lecanii RCEF 1005]